MQQLVQMSISLNLDFIIFFPLDLIRLIMCQTGGLLFQFRRSIKLALFQPDFRQIMKVTLEVTLLWKINPTDNGG